MAAAASGRCSLVLLQQTVDDRRCLQASVSSNCDRLHAFGNRRPQESFAASLRLRSRGCGSRLNLRSQSSANEVASPGISSEEASPAGGPPMIQVEFIPAKPPADGTSGVAEVTIGSGEKVLRNLMLDNKIELYALYGKVMNCGGGGSCGTCIVEILEGQELLSERTWAEDKYLKKKPSSWRLACQTIVGDKSNSGKVKVQQLPQTIKK